MKISPFLGGSPGADFATTFSPKCLIFQRSAL
jgi:hypothetical protein